MWWRLWPQTAWVWILSPPQAIKAWFSPMQKGGGHSVYFITFLFWGLNKIIYSKRFEWCWHIGSTQLELKWNKWHPHYPHKIPGPEDRKQVIARKARARIPSPVHLTTESLFLTISLPLLVRLLGSIPSFPPSPLIPMWPIHSELCCRQTIPLKLSSTARAGR